MNHAIIDCRMSLQCKKSLKILGYNLIEVCENPNLDKPISAHPDISVFCYKNIILTEANLKQSLTEQMFKEGERSYTVMEGCKFENKTSYPFDCTLNFALCGNKLIGNNKIISTALFDLAVREKFEIIHVNQGYAKCNICTVSENAIITEDKGIANTCKTNGIDVLLLNNNFVKLSGYKYGFIGGATGTVFDIKNGNKILFCGCIEKHPEYNLIKNFCKSHGAELISLSDDDLYDYGSIIII